MKDGPRNSPSIGKNSFEKDCVIRKWERKNSPCLDGRTERCINDNSTQRAARELRLVLKSCKSIGIELIRFWRFQVQTFMVNLIKMSGPIPEKMTFDFKFLLFSGIYRWNLMVYQENFLFLNVSAIFCDLVRSFAGHPTGQNQPKSEIVCIFC